MHHCDALIAMNCSCPPAPPFVSVVLDKRVLHLHVYITLGTIDSINHTLSLYISTYLPLLLSIHFHV
jgi:hypothetical protein